MQCPSVNRTIRSDFNHLPGNRLDALSGKTTINRFQSSYRVLEDIQECIRIHGISRTADLQFKPVCFVSHDHTGLAVNTYASIIPQLSGIIKLCWFSPAIGKYQLVVTPLLSIVFSYNATYSFALRDQDQS